MIYNYFKFHFDNLKYINAHISACLGQESKQYEKYNKCGKEQLII